MGLLVVLMGCSSEDRELARAMTLRDNLLSAQGCSFQASVTADYGEELYEFSMDCHGDSNGNLLFEIISPESIAGIKGTVSDSGGTLTFEDTALYFPLLTDDQLIPAAAPWIFLKTLRSGCLNSVCMEDSLLRITADDSYAEDALHLDIWVDEEDRPVQADILWDNRRILSLKVEEFVIS